MKIVLSENQFKTLYNMEDRPSFIDLSFIVETEDDEKTHDLGEPGEPDDHKLYFFYIGERFYDNFYDETYVQLFDEYSNQDDCVIFAEAVIEKMLQKVKQSVEDGTASKILKKVIKNQKVVKFRLSNIKDIFEKHFGNIICHEFLQDIR